MVYNPWIIARHQESTFQLPAVDITSACADNQFASANISDTYKVITVIKNMASLELARDLTGQVTRTDCQPVAWGGSVDIYRAKYLGRTVSISASLSVSAAQISLSSRSQLRL